MEYISNSDKETKKIAKDLAKTLKGGEVVGLVGNLGAGKTTFTQGLAKALGVTNTVTSPTFVLMKVYPVNHQSIKQLCHIDAYRITSYEDLVAIGAIDYLEASDCITVIEWADRVSLLLPKNSQIIELTNTIEGGRKIIKK